MHKQIFVAIAAGVLAFVQPLPAGDVIRRIAFGSCNRQDLPQPIWAAVADFQPQLWIWLGDNIYGDTDDMEVLRAKWDRQKSHPAYAALRSSAMVLGIWDDHDFGRNDAGSEYPFKEASKKLLLDFLDEPADSGRRGREGIHDCRLFGPEGRQVAVVLLDTRTFRSPRGSSGGLLGEAQWKWLEETLRGSSAQVHVICSGSQILPSEHTHEKWADHPADRQRLLELLDRLAKPGVILLSGDRHFGEISTLTAGNRVFHELTTSGMTHHWMSFPGEKNALRSGRPVVRKNFGTLEINWDARTMTASIRGVDGDVLESTVLPLAP